MVKGTLLLVEDHADTAQLMSRLLRREGYDVMVARTLAEAEPHCSGRTFDLLICDLSLPDGYGTELLAAGRPCATAPAIAVTARALPKDVAEALAGGFRRHLAKPLDLKRLLSAVRDALAACG